MLSPLRTSFAAALVAFSSGPLAQAGDYDQALFVLSKAFPEARTIGVFYDQSATLLNRLEFEGSASKDYGLDIKLIPIDGSKKVQPESVRKLCVQAGIQAVLFMEDDPLIKPGSPTAIAIVQGAGRAPLAAIHTSWLDKGAWFAVGPQTKGLQISPNAGKPETREALRLAGEALVKEGK
ncbi:hypothetical protein [Geothrix sp. PMB-07]|uniref:hypothetical protein n=1 Tax=Geothrix sp. PMB-07 TaxID=3068640 RepID=UPI002741327C|nr:hypothetical protein [Geothrix sp. PMB-07]WLT32589.1 hypothetical protein Q9293_04480 [Geothrix sp. PMB-07]